MTCHALSNRAYWQQMKPLLLLTLPFVCDLALAISPVPEPVAAEQTQAVLSPELTEEERQEQFMRGIYHTPFNGIMLFVHDRASADAAAPRLKLLLDSQPSGEELLHSEHILEHYFTQDCYGSAAFREVLAPHMQKDETATVQRFRTDCLPLLQQMNAGMLALAEDIEAVSDKASADKATAAIRAFPESIRELEEQLRQAMQPLEPSITEGYVMTCLNMGPTMKVLDRLIAAYARTLACHRDSYPELAEAFRELFTNAGMPTTMLDRMTPESFAQAETTTAALHEWLNIAATVRDKASADAAADWLEAKHSELGPMLRSSMHAQLADSFPSLSLARLSIKVRTANYYLQYASPAWFGSEKLEKQLSPIP